MNMAELKTRLWTKNFVLISTINFLLTLVFYLLVVTIAMYASNTYHATTSQAGLVTGTFIIGTLISRLFMGRLISQIGRKRTLWIGNLFFTLTTFLYFVEFGIAFLLFTRFVHGLALGMASTASGTIIAQIIPAARKGEGIGYYSMSATLATAFGPFIGLMMSQHASFAAIFLFCLMLGVLSLTLSIFVHLPPLETDSLELQTRGIKLSSYLEPAALPIAIITLGIAFCYSSVLSFLNSYAAEINLTEAASFFFIIYAISILISRPFTGRLMDLKGPNLIMYPGFILLASGMLLLGTANSTFTLLLSGVLIGLGFGNMQSCTQAIAVKLTPPHRMGLATSTFYIFLDGGLGFGPSLLGLIIPYTGFSYMFIYLGIGSLFLIILYYFLHGRKEREIRSQGKSTISL